MVNFTCAKTEQELLEEFPHHLRGEEDLGSLIYPHNYPFKGKIILEASIAQKKMPWSQLNVEFLIYLNAAETLFTIELCPELDHSPELTDVKDRCLKIISSLDVDNLPSLYL